MEAVEYYEHKDGSFGLRFPKGIETGKLAAMMKRANKKILQEELRAKKIKQSTK